MTCLHCKNRIKNWNGDDPKCAFEKNIFDSDNWMCATMSKLRGIAERHEVSYNEDQYLAVIPIKDEATFLILSWYKHRGRIEGAWIVDSALIRPLSEQEAYDIIEMYGE